MYDLVDETAIEPRRLYEAIEAGERFTLLDVRNRDEHEAWPIHGAPRTVVRPYQRVVAAQATDGVGNLLADIEAEAPGFRDDLVVAVCGRGEASDRAAGLLREAGVRAVNLTDGMRGWARVYDVAPVADVGGADGDRDVDVEVLQYRRPASGCLAYLVVAGDEAAVIDPLRAFADRYAADAAARGARLRYAIDTHVHADHVSGVREAVAAVDGADGDGDADAGVDAGVETPTVVVPAGAIDRGLAYDPAPRTVADGDALALGGTSIEAVHLPGHTSDLTGYRVGDVLFVGDTLFVDSVGRPDLERGDAGAREAARRLHDSLHGRVLSLPDDVLVAPGHYSPAAPRADDDTYTARVGDLRDRLGILALDESRFVERVSTDLPPRPNDYERVIETNLGAPVDDEAAFEMELGPNNCAVDAAGVEPADD